MKQPVERQHKLTPLDKLNITAQAVRPYIPFVVMNTVRRSISKLCQSLLDLGCGDGMMLQSLLKNTDMLTVGADIHHPSLINCSIHQTHQGLVMCDVRKLPFPKNSFDVVLCMELIEHLEKDEGIKLIKSLEEIARLQVIITTPVGFCRVQAPNSSAYDKHVSSWYPSEFKQLGYTIIRGHGIPQLYGDDSWFVRFPKILVPILYIFSVFVGPFVYYLPGLSGRMVCIKKISP